MATRTTETTVTFRRPFKLGAIQEPQPPGAYRLLIDEEEILGVSFLAYRRVATILHTPAISAATGSREAHVVDRADLEAALEADAAADRAL